MLLSEPPPPPTTLSLSSSRDPAKEEVLLRSQLLPNLNLSMAGGYETPAPLLSLTSLLAPLPLRSLSRSSDRGRPRPSDRDRDDERDSPGVPEEEETALGILGGSSHEMALIPPPV